jgi:hypothetical protein
MAAVRVAAGRVLAGGLLIVLGIPHGPVGGHGAAGDANGMPVRVLVEFVGPLEGVLRFSPHAVVQIGPAQFGVLDLQNELGGFGIVRGAGCGPFTRQSAHKGDGSGRGGQVQDVSSGAGTLGPWTPRLLLGLPTCAVNRPKWVR